VWDSITSFEEAPPLPDFVNDLSAEVLQAMLANPHLLSQVRGERGERGGGQ
jgi:hypothetical protein